MDAVRGQESPASGTIEVKTVKNVTDKNSEPDLKSCSESFVIPSP